MLLRGSLPEYGLRALEEAGMTPMFPPIPPAPPLSARYCRRRALVAAPASRVGRPPGGDELNDS